MGNSLLNQVMGFMRAAQQGPKLLKILNALYGNRLFGRPERRRWGGEYTGRDWRGHRGKGRPITFANLRGTPFEHRRFDPEIRRAVEHGLYRRARQCAKSAPNRAAKMLRRCIVPVNKASSA